MPPLRKDPLAGRVFVVRGQRVVLDADLARLYGATTKVFNQAIKRNGARFPRDFAFQMTQREFRELRASSTTGRGKAAEPATNWSQIVTSSKASRRGVSYRPRAFTEHGAVMAANVLRSPRAVAMSVYVVRTFVRMREELMSSAVIFGRLAEIDKALVEHDAALRMLWSRLRPLLAPPPEPSPREMGFHAGMKKRSE